jgi:hypothetical protein
MSLLTLNSTPAERLLGCTFSENFWSVGHVVRNGGSIVGTPVIDKGVILNGSTDSVVYRLQGHEFYSANISIVIEFWPDFDYDSDSQHYLFDTSSPYRYLVYKREDAGSNILGILLGNTTIASIASATYGPYWKVGERNVLVVSGTSGSTDAWLNAEQILTNNTTAWTPDAPTQLMVGARYSDSGTLFDGKITKVSVFNFLLTEHDAIRLYNDDVYEYKKHLVFDLPMGAAQHDPTNVQTLDVSGNDFHAEFGDGSTSTTFPTKENTIGYYFDSGDHMEIASFSDTYFNSDFSVCGTLDLRAITGDAGIWTLRDAVNDGCYLTYDEDLQRFKCHYGALYTEFTFETPDPPNICTYAVVGDADGLFYLYVNGLLKDTANISPSSISVTDTVLFLGCLANSGSPLVRLKGVMHQCIALFKV